MSDQVERVITAADLPMTLYLNQRMTFDLLATLEGGFTNFATVQTTSSGETTTELSGGAQLGISNVFAFLGMQLGGHGSRQAGQKLSESTTENIVHTPVSLFARLRNELQDRDLVRSMSTSFNLDELRPSEFVEFEATLRRHQLMVQLSAFAELIPLMGTFEESSSPKSSRQRRQGKSTASPTLKQVNSLLSALTSGESRDLVSRIGETNVVITTEQQYFNDPTMNDIIDGTFHIFGKATRVIPKGDDATISLLRKAPLGQFKAILPAIAEAMSQFESLGQSGDPTTEIQGPAIQVMPIAIFS